jgi:hypothetical protein
MENFLAFLSYETPRWPFRWGPFGGKKRVCVAVSGLRLEVVQKEAGELTTVPVVLRCKTENGRLVTSARYRATQWTPQVTLP